MKNPVLNRDRTHPADLNSIAATKVRDDMLQLAASSQDRPRQLLPAAAQQVPIDVFLKVGKQDSIKHAIQRKRRGQLPKEPATLKVKLSMFGC